MKSGRYLFLQGQISRFFSELGAGLLQRGHAVHRINFNGGDGRFWHLPGSVDFAGLATDWPAFLVGQFDALHTTDLILFGDCRPLHMAAIALAKARGITVHVFEEGYLRPHFVTLEQDGVNGHSTLPRDAETCFRAAAGLPPFQPGQTVPASFARRALEDVIYNLSTVAAARRFPHYQSHRPWHPMLEYVVGMRRIPVKAIGHRKTGQRARALWESTTPYFLFPLQLEADSQIRAHAPAGGMLGAIRTVMQSFAIHAPHDALLVITEHPLDYGPVHLADAISELARTLSLSSRLVFLRGGSPAPLVNAARGLVTVNSTIGITALEAQVPVITLGTAIYDMAGLTCQQGIDAFWTNPLRPEPTLFDAFRRVVAARTQINGGFYSEQGIAMAVAGAIRRLEQAATALVESAPRRPLAAESVTETAHPIWPTLDTAAAQA